MWGNCHLCLGRLLCCVPGAMGRRVHGMGPTLSACMRLALHVGRAMWSVLGDRLLVSTKTWWVQEFDAQCS